jgi:hypothetical protein
MPAAGVPADWQQVGWMRDTRSGCRIARPYHGYAPPTKHVVALLIDNDFHLLGAPDQIPIMLMSTGSHERRRGSRQVFALINFGVTMLDEGGRASVAVGLFGHEW